MTNQHNKLEKTSLKLLRWHLAIGTDCFYHDKPQNRLLQTTKSTKPLTTPITTLPKITFGPEVTNASHNITHNSTKINTDITIAQQLADNASTLAELELAVRQFDGCKLKDFAHSTVFADHRFESYFRDNKRRDDPPIMFIGEAPGANEDKHGIPFCGQSGKLLDNVIASMKLDRTKAYITNSVFWRPPGNRRPTPQEIQMCRPFVERHIALLAPKLLVLVGGTAAESVLGKTDPISTLRKQDVKYTNQYLATPIPAVIIFHPSYLLRQPTQKKEMWFDVLKIMTNFLNHAKNENI